MSEISLVNIGKSYSDNRVIVKNISIDIAEGEFVVFVGPSGCGKTTTLNMIAGLESITEGDLFIDGIRVNDLPAKDRDIAMVFQSYALYPHMTVRGNIAFPLEMAKLHKFAIDAKVEEIAALLDLIDVLDRKPNQLSGGQRQRVAIGRALVRNPKAFLMDEPLSNLDAKLRSQMRNELLYLHRKLRTTTIYVTHDQVEAMTLGDRLVVFADGTIQQIGSSQELYNQPKNIFVAGFIGSPAMNFLPAQLTESGLRTPIGEVRLLDISFLIDQAKKIGMSDNSVIIGVRPESIFIQESATKNPHSIYFSSQVDFVETLGVDQIIHLNISTTRFVVAGAAAKKNVNYVYYFTESGARKHVFDLSARVSHHKPIGVGSIVNIVTAADAISIFDPETGQNLRCK